MDETDLLSLFVSEVLYDFDAVASVYHQDSRSLDDEEHQIEKLYVVPYWWLDDVRNGCRMGGVEVLYNVASEIDRDNEVIRLHLRRGTAKSGVDGSGQNGFSGRACALISESMWVWALYRLRDSRLSMKGVSSLLPLQDHFPDVFPLQIRISLSMENNAVVAKINSKDNTSSYFLMARHVFGPLSQMSYIWDFSGQITQFLKNDRTELPKEIPLELHIHGYADVVETSHEKIDQMTENEKFGSIHLMGLRGLQNLGNTCFMNSAIQCLAHTPRLVDYFLGDHVKEINYENPLGMKGELALNFGELLRKLWSPGTAPVVPTMFKKTLAKFANHFNGCNQHDSQEFLSFLLDGLHEDLNHAKHKPYIEAKDANGRPNNEVANEYWRNHLARNDSIIVDLCQGQYQSTLICPICKTKSVTFDPYMYLSLPLPSTMMRSMTLAVLSINYLPSPFTVSVPRNGTLNDLSAALSLACSLGDNEMLLVAKILTNGVINFSVDPSDPLALIRDEDVLVAYRLPRDDETSSSLVVFMHERLELLRNPGEFLTSTFGWKLFGIPMVSRLSAFSNGSDLRKQYLKLLDPFFRPCDAELIDYDDSGAETDEDSAMQDAISFTTSDTDESSENEYFTTDFQFYLNGDIGCREIKMNEPLPFSKCTEKFNVIVKWPENMMKKYDIDCLSFLPAIFNPELYTRMPEESISLHTCLEAFLKEEPLGPEDMWYCPTCRKNQQANKKLDLRRLPEVLVVHLKRFSCSEIFSEKLETYVDFPINNFDLSNYTSFNDSESNNNYVLYAITNHYGGTDGGHYTAFVDNGKHNWHWFDDDMVAPVTEDSIKSSAAYVLFYRRVQ